MGLIEKLRAKQREYDRARYVWENGRWRYDLQSVDMAELLGQAADTLEGQAVLIDQPRRVA
jgi:hypothetical protein